MLFHVPVRDGRFILLLDAQPLVALLAATLHEDQRPRTVQLLAMQSELQISACNLVEAIFLPDELKHASIPQHDASCAIVALRDIALKIAIAEWMILHHGREVFLRRIERWALWHGPRFQRACDLQAKVVVEVRGVVPLHEESPRPG